MAFSLKTWVNRISEYPNRRKLTHEDGSTELVTVARAEGQISAEGNAFSAEEMNDLENRIKGGFDEVNQSLANTIAYGLINIGGSLKANVIKELELMIIPAIMFAFINYNGKYYTAISLPNTIGEFSVDNIKIHYTINGKIIDLTSNVDCTLQGIYALANLSAYPI